MDYNLEVEIEVAQDVGRRNQEKKARIAMPDPSARFVIERQSRQSREEVDVQRKEKREQETSEERAKGERGRFG